MRASMVSGDPAVTPTPKSDASPPAVRREHDVVRERPRHRMASSRYVHHSPGYGGFFGWHAGGVPDQAGLD